MSRNNPVPKEPEEVHLIGFTTKQLKFIAAAVKLAQEVVKRDHAIIEFRGETVCRDEGNSFKEVLNTLRGK